MTSGPVVALPARSLEGLDHVTLATLAGLIGVRSATLRQRIARGTLAARKFGPVWAVSGIEAQRVYDEAKARAR